MSQNTLVTVHLSSLFTSSALVTSHAVPTSRRDIPFAASQGHSDFPETHAPQASIFSSPLTGQILIRVVLGGLAVELVSLSTDIPPVRFVFPAPVVPSPGLVLCQNSEIHLIVVTEAASLHRIVIPVQEGNQLWHEPLGRDWCREWAIKKASSSQVILAHVQDFHSVVLGLNNGGILRLDADYSDEEQFNELWSETEYKLNTWYTFLPTLPSNQPSPSEIISLASLPPPTEVTDTFSLSRDRILRRWTVAKGCRGEVTLNLGGLPAHSGDKFNTLLDPTPRKHIQVLAGPTNTSEDQTILVFVTTPSSPLAGGYFQSYNAHLSLIGTWMCSSTSAHWKLQDFVFANGTLNLLWEKQGQPLFEWAKFDGESQDINWNVASYTLDIELSQARLDESLLTPGSLADKFMQEILRPGVFSPVSIHGAIREYTDHYLSLPGTHPPALTTSYTTLGEHIAAVVGCTVSLAHDPQTGMPQYKHYWNALKRDWEGFVARCREIERSARWPVGLGYDPNGQAIVLERERIGKSIPEDLPLRIQRQLKDCLPLEPAYSLLETCWALRTKLSPQVMRQVESEFLNILGQELGFSLADIVMEASNRAFAPDDIDENTESWVTTRIASINDMDQTIRTVLDVIVSLEKTVKQEEDEVELIIPPPMSEWNRALVATFIMENVETRYNLCLTLAIGLFIMGPDLTKYDPALLAEVFAVFRGIAMLRYLCRQPAGDLDGMRPSMKDSSTSEDVVMRFSNMHMSRGVRNPNPNYSLIHRLLSQMDHTSLLPAAAHYFLDQTGLLSTVSPAVATKSEVLICDKLRVLGYREVSQKMLAWLPRTPSVMYVLGKLWLDGGRPGEAALVFQGIAGCFGPEGSISLEDNEALSSMLPGGKLFPSEWEYYTHVAGLFRSAGLVSYEVQFSKLALSVVPDDVDAVELWDTIIKGYTDLGLYEDAYFAIVTTPYEKLKQHCVGVLVYKMCEDNVIDRLMSINFYGLTGDVEESMSFKARNADPRSQPNFAQILYTWYILRGDYRNAASTMYIRSRKLSDLPYDAAQAQTLAEQQLEALSLSINALSVIDSKDAWIIVPIAIGARKKRKLQNHIPEEKFAPGQRDVDVVLLPQIRQEYILLNASLELMRRDPSHLRNGENTPWLVVSKLTQAGLFDTAMFTARSLDVDMVELFQRLAIQCLRLASSPDASILEAGVDWLLTDKVSSWPGTPADRGWRFLRHSLEKQDSVENDLKYSKAVLDTLLSHAPASAPPWLIQRLQEHHPDYLIRACLRYDLVEEALTYTLHLTRKANPTTNLPQQASNTWLPYTLIDAVLNAADEKVSGNDAKSSTASEGISLIRMLRDALRGELKNRINRLEKRSEKTVR